MGKKVIVIGGGVAGMEAASTLVRLGHNPVIIEKNTTLGGKLNNWHKLFPTLTPAAEVLGQMRSRLDGVDIMTGTEVETVCCTGVTLTDGRQLHSDAVIVASGFELFKAEKKEEYGYGLYDNVYSTVDLERMFTEGKIAMRDGSTPKTIAFLHCVGSRDEKVNQKHCSRVCCVTGVKQAMEVKEFLPEANVYNFYMDIRMFGPGYEEMYRQAQEQYNITFIRGRISEASETMDKRVQIKAEDTLIGRPLKMTVDMLILIVGMTAGESNLRFCKTEGMERYPSDFMKPKDQFKNNVCSNVDNIFYAGAVSAPKNVGESINEGMAAALKADEYLKTVAGA